MALLRGRLTCDGEVILILSESRRRIAHDAGSWGRSLLIERTRRVYSFQEASLPLRIRTMELVYLAYLFGILGPFDFGMDPSRPFHPFDPSHPFDPFAPFVLDMDLFPLVEEELQTCFMKTISSPIVQRMDSFSFLKSTLCLLS